MTGYYSLTDRAPAQHPANPADPAKHWGSIARFVRVAAGRRYVPIWGGCGVWGQAVVPSVLHIHYYTVVLPTVQSVSFLQLVSLVSHP